MKRRAPWQPSLLDPDTPPAPAREEVVPAPPPPSEPGRRSTDEPVWWQRARRHASAEEQASPPPARRPTRHSGFSAGGRWRRMMLDGGWFNDLRPGDRKELAERVRGLEWRGGAIEAAVHGEGRPARVQLRLSPLGPADAARVARVLAEDFEAGASPDPESVEAAADSAGVPLWPQRIREVAGTCSCGRAQRPCEHVVAVHLALAIELDGSVLPLVVLRGLSHETLHPLLERVQAERPVLQAPSERAADPFTMGEGPPPDWSALDRLPRKPPELPDPTGWRNPESFQALTRRLIDKALGREEETMAPEGTGTAGRGR